MYNVLVLWGFLTALQFAKLTKVEFVLKKGFHERASSLKCGKQGQKCIHRLFAKLNRISLILGYNLNMMQMVNFKSIIPAHKHNNKNLI